MSPSDRSREPAATLERREFLKLAGLLAGAAGLGGCSPRWSVPERLVEMALRGPGLETEVQSICGLCPGGCGITVRLVDGLPVGIKGNPSYPLNRGGLCPVGQAGLDVLYSPDRLQTPMVKNAGGRFETAQWSTVVEQITARLEKLSARGEGERIALLVDSPSDLLYDIAARLASLLGTPHVGRVEGESAIPYSLCQGIEEPPGFDLENTDLVFTLGLDLFEDGVAPVRAIAAMVGERPFEERCSVIYAGTRLSPTAARSEEVVVVRPGTHGALALGVAHVLVSEGKYDSAFVEQHTFGFEDWIDERGHSRLGFRRLLLERYYPDRVAQLCGVEASTVVRVARRVAAADRPLAVVGREAVQATNGTWAVLATQALNALVGSFGRAGGIVQPSPVPMKALPGSASRLPDGANLFTAVPEQTALGVDPVDALAQRVLSSESPIEVLLVVGGDPVHSSPAGGKLLEALERIPMVVAMVPFANRTARAAHVVLPTHTPLEDWRAGTTPGGVSFGVLGLAKPVVEPLYESRGVGDLLLELGRGVLGGDSVGLPWTTYSEYLEDRLGGLGLSGEGAIVSGSFEERWKHFLEERGWRFHERVRAEDFWRDLTRHAGWWNPVRFGANWDRFFQTTTGRFEFHSLALERHLRELGTTSGGSVQDGDDLSRGAAVLGLRGAPEELCLPHFEPLAEAGDDELLMIPFQLPTGRGDLADTSRMVMEMFGYTVLSGWRTWAELSAATAHDLGLGDGDLVSLETEAGSIEAVVRVVPEAAPRTVHVPLGLGRSRDLQAGRAVGHNPLDIVAPLRDPISGSLATGPCAVRARLMKRRQRGGPAPWHGGRSG